MSLAPFLFSPQPWLVCGMLMEPRYNEVPWYQKIVCYSRFFALAKQSEPRGSLGRRLFAGTVKPHYKNFLTIMSSYLSLCSLQDKQMFAVVFRHRGSKKIRSNGRKNGNFISMRKSVKQCE